MYGLQPVAGFGLQWDMLAAELAVLDAVLAAIDAQGSVDTFITRLTDVYPHSDPPPLPSPKPVKLVTVLIAPDALKKNIAQLVVQTSVFDRTKIAASEVRDLTPDVPRIVGEGDLGGGLDNSTTASKPTFEFGERLNQIRRPINLPPSKPVYDRAIRRPVDPPQETRSGRVVKRRVLDPMPLIQPPAKKRKKAAGRREETVGMYIIEHFFALLSSHPSQMRLF